jgi:hypothetical protein
MQKNASDDPTRKPDQLDRESNRAKDREPQDPVEANQNIRKAQGDDSAIGRTGNRPRFDRDR